MYMRCYRVKMSIRGLVLAELRIEEYLIRSFSSEIPSFTFTKMYNIKGVARGGPGVPVILPFASLFLTKQPTTGGQNATTIP